MIAVSCKATHGVDKILRPAIRLIAGHGVEGDAHFGARVKHRSRARTNPEQPNLRQVHLLHSELFDELAGQGFEIVAGRMGENVTTRGLDLLSLSRGARLRLGAEAVVELTGLRNPCIQLEGLAPGLMAACLDRTSKGETIRKAGVMSIVIRGGEVRAGDPIVVEPTAGEWLPLKPV